MYLGRKEAAEVQDRWSITVGMVFSWHWKILLLLLIIQQLKIGLEFVR